MPCLMYAHSDCLQRFLVFLETSTSATSSLLFFSFIFFSLFLYHPEVSFLNLFIVPFCNSALKIIVVKSHIHLSTFLNHSGGFEPQPLQLCLKYFNKVIHVWKCANRFVSVALCSCSSSCVPQRQSPANNPKRATDSWKNNPVPEECEWMEFCEHVPHGVCYWEFGNLGSIYILINMVVLHSLLGRRAKARNFSETL